MKFLFKIAMANLLIMAGMGLSRGAPGDIDPGFDPGASSRVHSVAVQADGKILIVGLFTNVAGVGRYGVARLNSDGAVDLLFNPGTNGTADSIAVQVDQKLIIGGDFTNAAGFENEHIVRVTPDGVNHSYTTRTDNIVHSIALQPDGQAVVAGTYTVLNNNISRINRLSVSNGTRESGFSGSGPNSSVYAIAIQPDGKIIVGGYFTSFNGSTRNYIARMNASGSVDSTFAPVLNKIAEAVAVQKDGKILIGGEFSTIGGVTRNRLARLNMDGSLDTTFNAAMSTGAFDSVRSIAIQADGKIVIGGRFTTVGGVANEGIARLHPNGSRDTTFVAKLPSSSSQEVYALAIQGDGKVLLGGAFTKVNGVDRDYVARVLNDPAIQSLTVPSPSLVQWLRGGSAPETHYVTFEVSLDDGNSWTPLGAGTRTSGGWELTGVNLSQNNLVRARALIPCGRHNGSSGWVESVAVADFIATQAPTLLSPAANTVMRNPLPVSFTLPEAALDGSLKLIFEDGNTTRTLTLANSQGIAGAHSFSFDPANPSGTAAIASGPAIPDGTYSVRLTYQDAAANPAGTSQTATTFRVDTTAPNLALPAPIVMEAQNASGRTVNFTVSRTDAMDSTPSLNVSPASGSLFPIGTSTVNVSSTDWAGNTRTGSFTVTVRDTTQPVVSGTFAPTLLATGPAGMALLPDYLAQATAMDAVGVASIVQIPAAGSAVSAGNTNVTIAATDAAGNVGTKSINVIVNDATIPAVAAPAGGFTPLTLIVGASGTAPLPDYASQAIKSDNAGITNTTQTPPPGSQCPPGNIIVTITVSDAAGNTNSMNLTATAVDTTLPSISPPAGGFVPLTLTTGPGGTVALPDYSLQALTNDNVMIIETTQSPTAGSMRTAGATAVTITTQDAAGNTKSTHFDVTVNDGTKPGIRAPLNGFAPLAITCDANGEAILPDYTTQSITEDNVEVTDITQVPVPGSIRSFGRTTVTLTAHDAAGNTQETSFDVFVVIGDPLVNSIASTGALVPGAGVDPRIPANAVFTSVGIPAIDDSRGVAFLGKWKSNLGVGVGIFTGETPSLIVAVGDDAYGIDGAKFKSLNDPVIAPNGMLAFGGTVQGSSIKPGNDFGLWMTDAGIPRLVLREGAKVPGGPVGNSLKTVTGISMRDGELLATVTLAPLKGLVTAANDSALLCITPTKTTILLSEGALLNPLDGGPSSAIKSIHALIPSVGSPAHGRSHSDGSAVVRITLTDKRTAILDIESDGTQNIRLITGDGAPSVGATAYWTSPGLPAIDTRGDAVVLKAMLAAAPMPGAIPAVTKKTDTALGFHDGNDFTIFAREGYAVPSVVDASFTSFFDPLVNDNGEVAFIATIAGKGITAKNNTGLWWGDAGSLFLLARAGSPAPSLGAAPSPGFWGRIQSLALPSGEGGGPVFVATLTGKDITAKNNTTLWAVDSTGTLRLLLRTGDLLEGKAITGIHALSTVQGALGASRGYNARGAIVVRVLFKGGGQSVVRMDLPDGKARLLSPGDH